MWYKLERGTYNRGNGIRSPVHELMTRYTGPVRHEIDDSAVVGRVRIHETPFWDDRGDFGIPSEVDAFFLHKKTGPKDGY